MISILIVKIYTLLLHNVNPSDAVLIDINEL